jgi:hypothetical protein
MFFKPAFNIYKLILVPNNFKNSRTSDACPGQAGEVARFPSTTVSVGGTSWNFPPAKVTSGFTAG